MEIIAWVSQCLWSSVVHRQKESEIMIIDWYPGHMKKARAQIIEILPKIDLVIEVLDARLPSSSANPLLARLRGISPVSRS